MNKFAVTLTESQIQFIEQALYCALRAGFVSESHNPVEMSVLLDDVQYALANAKSN